MSSVRTCVVCDRRFHTTALDVEDCEPCTRKIRELLKRREPLSMDEAAIKRLMSEFYFV